MEDKILKASYTGVLNIGNADLLCYVLEDGTRVLAATSFFKAFDRPRKGRKSQEDRQFFEGTELPSFLPKNIFEAYKKAAIDAKNVSILADINDIIEGTKPIQFYDGGKLKSGYKSNLLVKTCELYSRAKDMELLRDSQIQVAEKAKILLYAFASVGIDGLIDEATGYKHDPKYAGLRVLLNQYIAEGLQKWTRTFPDKFFEYLDKLYGNEKTTSQNRPRYYGRFINAHIYEPIEKGYVKERLDELNINDDGTRKARFHQWLTEFGKSQLILQIGQVMGLMQFSASKRFFEDKVKRLGSPQISMFDEEQWEKLIDKKI